jgi:multicomponent Na+:H+ antiporter subunit B
VKDLILRTAAAYLTPLLLLFSVFLLVRGHNEPGGGFAGGLVAAAAFVLLSIASGVALARRILRVDPRSLVGAGLLIMLIAGVMVPLLDGRPYLTAAWWQLPLPGGTSIGIGTPLLFDVGVYLAVLGTVLTVTFALEEEPT